MMKNQSFRQYLSVWFSLFVAVVIITSTTVLGQTIQLPQTGQTKCYDWQPPWAEIPCAGTGQDGEYRMGAAWPDPRFSITYCSNSGGCADPNTDCDGNALNDVVTDNLTGLMWTRLAIMPEGVTFWWNAIDYANDLVLCGFSDWRLPNVNELESLFNAGTVDPPAWLVAQGFIGIYGPEYWSSTTWSGDPNLAWGFGTLGLNVITFEKGWFKAAWPVRTGSAIASAPVKVYRTGQTISYRPGDDGEHQAGVPWPSPRFVVHGETVTDNLTGLMWTRSAITPGPPECSGNLQLRWGDSFTYAQCLNANSYLGYTDWRIPNRKEFLSLIDHSRYDPALPFGHPFGVMAGRYPTSTSFANIPDNFFWIGLDGWVDGFLKLAEMYNWPVRGGQTTLNMPPVGNAGADQSLDESTAVTLDGSASSDLEGSSLTYTWIQVAGPVVALNLNEPSNPTFTAPAVPAGGATLTFQLTVNDGIVTSEPDIVNIFVKNVNHPPVADAGDDQTVKEGSPVTLSGQDSYDTDGETLAYTWTQLSGPSVALSDPTSMLVAFIAPSVGPSGTSFSFVLTVSDGIEQTADVVNVFVENVNHPPVADAGNDQTKNEASIVTLNGYASSDPDGDTLSYAWVQVSGPSVVLSDTSSPTPSFTAPFVNAGGTALIFSLTVDDGLGGLASDEVSIHIANANDPPNCSLAVANPAILWPPNHSMVPVAISNLADPNNNQVTITIINISQDEPIDGLGDGDTSPDAGISGSNVLIRSERSGTGNGRVYQINFRADDSFGEGCTGTVTVCVPHSRKGTCTDSGWSFNSFEQ